jgi:hypothetical protein
MGIGSRSSAVVGLMALALLAPAAGAATSISTLPIDWNIPWQPFGESNTATYGQTITVPTDNVLNSFSFYMDDYGSTIDPEPVVFAGYVMAWAGDHATGPVLWSSAPMTSTNNHGAGSWELFTFDTGDLALTPGAQYVLIISASEYFNGVLGRGQVPNGLTPYTDGYVAFLNNGSDFSALTSWSWIVVASKDFAFEAEFSPSDPVIPTVPAPGAILLAGLGTALVSRLRRASPRRVSPCGVFHSSTDFTEPVPSKAEGFTPIG